MIRLLARDEVRALVFAAFDMRLARDLERRFDRFGTACHERDAPKVARRALAQPVG